MKYIFFGSLITAKISNFLVPLYFMHVIHLKLLLFKQPLTSLYKSFYHHRITKISHTGNPCPILDTPSLHPVTTNFVELSTSYQSPLKPIHFSLIIQKASKIQKIPLFLRIPIYFHKNLPNLQFSSKQLNLSLLLNFNIHSFLIVPPIYFFESVQFTNTSNALKTI